VAPEIESGGAPTAKGDVFSFAPIVSRIVADNRATGTVPKFFVDLIADGLSAQSYQRPWFGAIIARSEVKGFENENGVDSEAVSALVRAVAAAEP
jgi:hypothetical protein